MPGGVEDTAAVLLIGAIVVVTVVEGLNEVGVAAKEVVIVVEGLGVDVLLFWVFVEVSVVVLIEFVLLDVARTVIFDVVDEAIIVVEVLLDFVLVFAVVVGFVVVVLPAMNGFGHV